MTGRTCGPSYVCFGFKGCSQDAADSSCGMIIFRKPVPELTTAALARFVPRARAAAGLRGSVNVLVTSGREMQTLNRRFRGRNQETDVLSFPAAPGMVKGFAGDIAVSARMAARNAQQLGHSHADEIKILILHGMLHLAGHDHELDNGQMARREAQLRKSLGLPVGLIERNAPKGLEPRSRRENLPRAQRKALAERRSTRLGRWPGPTQASR